MTPDEAVFAATVARLATVDDLSHYPFAEQDFLNKFYRDRWPTAYVYNALKTLQHQNPSVWCPALATTVTASSTGRG
ncbi:hypothetical protein FQ377_12300 [Arthrobacter echini]|uniref:Uncharacterized protein n=1 Tax=Arthrobacter echini TaxID=1529066 RepID=A0A5D0XQ68_9MICC|nr:hypothetical protein [Arthrobacter echini]TYC97981.1 hypothetical protein FQ377_12300 [Arthrobacter echini]